MTKPYIIFINDTPSMESNLLTDNPTYTKVLTKSEDINAYQLEDIYHD